MPRPAPNWQMLPAYSLQAPFLSMPSLTASAAAKVGTGLLATL